jgi:hypothetical protein
MKYWVKPKSTTWFSKFFVMEFDEERWVENFCITKHNLFNIANHLRPLIIKQDKKYRKDIPIEIQVCCAIYKLTHGSNFWPIVNCLQLESQICPLHLLNLSLLLMKLIKIWLIDPREELRQLSWRSLDYDVVFFLCKDK